MNLINLVIETILELKRQNGILTDHETDILSTFTKYCERPFDRKGAEQKSVENNIKYPDIIAMISAISGTVIKPFNQSVDTEVIDNLKKQIEAMCIKECHY